MTEAEDDIVGDHSRVMRGMSATGMRLMEIIQRRKEEQRRREADGQREAAEALRDRQQAQRDAARTIAAQGLDPQWREHASDSEIATAYVYAEAYAQTDPLARVAHDQLSDHLTARHENVVEFVDANVSQDALDRVPAPEGTPSPTQQRWIDAARAGDAAERSRETLNNPEAKDAPNVRVLDAEELQHSSDQTVRALLGEEPHTAFVSWTPQQDGPATVTVLDPIVLDRWADNTLDGLFGQSPDSVTLIPDLSGAQEEQRIKEHLATVGEDVANQWADLTDQYGRERADKWLEGNLTESEMAETNKWLWWNEAQREIAEGASIQEQMEQLMAREAELGLDPGLDLAQPSSGEELADDVAEAESNATTALKRGDMERAGVGQFPHDEQAMNDLAEIDPQAANVLATTKPGRTVPAAEQVAEADGKHVRHRSARGARRERGGEHDHGR